MSEEQRFSWELDEDETFWRDHAHWLKERGYQLRPRYQPSWKPSWLSKKSSRNRYEFEDSHQAKEPYHLMDGLRTSDKRLIMFKKIRLNDPANPTREIRMSQLFSSSGFLPSDSPHNHCVPIYEILKVPEDEHENLIVMPFLEDWWPYWWELPFDTVGEAMGFIRQLFEGVQSLHHHHIAHNDIKWDNIMVDSAPLYRRLQHPTENRYTYDWKGGLTRRSLTRYPVKYFFIDFDQSRKYDLEAGPPREPPGYGGDRSVPEFKSRPNELCDPFSVEIYRLGNFIRRFLMSSQQYHELDEVDDLKYNHSLDFLSELVTDMTQDDPTKRPGIDQVVERFDEIVKKLGFFQLRSQFWPGYSGNWLVRTLWKTPRHIVSQVINFLGRYPPIPPTPGPPKGRKSR